MAALSSFHEFTGPEPLAYDEAGTDAGNRWKVAKELAAYDEDAGMAVSLLLGTRTCNGRAGATGMCLGGHQAFRCAMANQLILRRRNFSPWALRIFSHLKQMRAG